MIRRYWPSIALATAVFAFLAFLSIIAPANEIAPTPSVDAQIVRSPLPVRSALPGRGVTNTPAHTPTITRTPTRTNTPTITLTPLVSSTPTQTLAPTATASGSGVTRQVGPGQTYTSISAAAAVAAPGDTINVHAGTYLEMPILTQNGLILKNNSGDSPVVDGSCSNQFGIWVDANDVTVRGITVQNVVEAGITVRNSRARATIDQNRVQDYNCLDDPENQFKAGISLYGSGPGQRVTSNFIIRRFNILQPLPGMGDGIYFNSQSSNPSGGGHYVADNIILGGFDGIGTEVEADPRGGVDRDTIIERNQVTRCTDDGIQVEGGGQNVFVQDNTISDCSIGIAFAAPYTGPLTVQRNTISLRITDSYHGDMPCFKIGNPSSARINLFGNKCISDVPSNFGAGADAGKGIAQTNPGLPILVTDNNEFNVSGYVFEFMGPGVNPLPSGSSLNNDCMRSIDSTGRFVKMGADSTGGSIQYGSLAAFTAATGFEAQGRGGPNPPPACTGDGQAPPVLTQAPTPTIPSPTPTITGTPFTPTPVIAITFGPTSTAVAGTIRQVGAGQTFTTINAAISAANNGDTINVHVGTYPEIVQLSKPALTLKAAGDGQPWVTGGCTRSNGIVISADDVRVLNIGVKQTISAGISIGSQKARMTLDGNLIQDWNCTDLGDDDPTWIANGRNPKTPCCIKGDQLDAGIQAFYSGPGHRIVNNTLKRRVEAAGSVYGQGDGIFFKSASQSGQTSGGGHYIAYNNIDGGFDGIGGEVEQDPRGTFDRNTVIEHNTISRCWDDGVQTEGGGDHIYVQDNTITECATGIAAATPLTAGQPTYLLRNLIITNTPGFYGEEICFKVGNPSPALVFILQNLCQVDTPTTVPLGTNLGKGIQQTNTGIGTLVTYGNTFIVSGYVFEFTDTLGPGSSLEFDCGQTTDPGRYIKWINVNRGTLSAFQTAVPSQEHFMRSSGCVIGPTATPTITPTPSQTFTAGPTLTFTLTPTITLTPTQAPTPIVGLVHATTSNAAPAPAAITIPATTINNLLVVCVSNPDSRLVSTITGGGLAWAAAENQSGSGTGAAIFYAVDTVGGLTSITVNMSGSTTPHVDIGEFSGNATTSVLGNSGHAGPTTSQNPSVSWTPQSAGNLIVGCGGGAGLRTWSKATNYFKLSTDSGARVGQSQYRLQAAGGPETSPFSLDASTTWIEVAAEFKNSVIGRLEQWTEALSYDTNDDPGPWRIWYADRRRQPLAL